MIINCYLSFDGQCKEAFEFYQRVLGGEIDLMLTYGDTPMADQTPEDQRGRIMHIRLKIGDNVLMGGDAPSQFASKPAGFSVSMTLKDTEEGKRIFTALSENGKVMMPFEETFFSPGFGMAIDQFGTPWMVNTEH